MLPIQPERRSLLRATGQVPEARSALPDPLRRAVLAHSITTLVVTDLFIGTQGYF